MNFCQRLFTRQQKSDSAVFEYYAIADDFIKFGAFFESRVFLVLVHVNENKSFAWDIAVNMNIDMQIGQLQSPVCT